MSVTVVPVETAINILNGSQHKGADCLINVYGKVTCVSEIIKLKDNNLFMVKFIPNVDLIIKRQEFMKWQKELVPHTEYILTNLRPTSLQKGSRSSHRVFTVTRNSELFQPDTINMVLMTESDIIKQYGLQDGHDITHIDRQDSSIDRLFSYQGKVTAVLDQGFGVFELDNTVRLFVGLIPAIHKFTKLTEGTTVLVQNAHYRTSKQYPRVSVYCCMLTKVHCVDDKSVNNQQADAVKLNQEVKKLLYLQGLSQNQLDHMFALRIILKKQFLNTLGDRVTDGIFTKIVTNEWLNDKKKSIEEKCPQRNLVDEFLVVPHNCPLVRDDTVTKMFTTIIDLKASIPEITNDNMEWKFSRQLSQQVVVGILSVIKDTGQTVLYDDTGSIDFVSCCFHGNKDKDESCFHSCTDSCDCDVIDVGDKFKCPYAHTCCLGKVVAVTLCETICETVVMSNIEEMRFVSRTDRSRSDTCEKYLLVDMRNVVYIGNSTEVRNSKSKQKVNNDANKQETITEEKANFKLTSCSDDIGRTSVVNHSKGDALDSEHVACENDQKYSLRFSDQGDCVLKNSSSTGEHKKTSLHKHVKEDGSIIFCRKLECCDLDTTCVLINRNKIDPSVSHNNTNNNVNPDIKACDENNENGCPNLESKTGKSNTLPFKLGKSAFKVKAISNRKRSFVGNYSETRIESVPNKIPKSVESDNLLKDSVINNDESSKMVENKCVRGDNTWDKQNSNPSQVTIYIQNKGSLLCVDGQRRFNVECAILDKQDVEEVILEITGKAVKWYPVLYVGTIYILSTDREPVLSDRLSNDKVRKMVLKNKSRRCLSVIENVCVTKQWKMSPQSNILMSPSLVSLQDIVKAEFTEKFVSFEGHIINRALVKQGFDKKSMAKDTGGGCMYSRLHVQDASGSEDIWVFLNDRNIACEKGLTPGNMVRFYGLERKISQLNNIYTRLVPLSSVQILCSQSEKGDSKQELDIELDAKSKQLPILPLSDLWTSSNSGQVFKCVCDIEKILKVSLKCLCEICGSLVIHSQCSNSACHVEGAYRFLARASAIIDDSTSVAMVTLTGSSVQSLLQLSTDQWQCLIEEVSKYGEVFVQQYNPSLTTCLERFVYRLCDNHAVKQTWLLTMRSRSSLDINKIGHDEFCMKTFETGSSRISTQCLPFLHLECLSMHVFEPSTWAIHHLIENT